MSATLAERAVVSDDGRAILLAAYRAAERLVEVEINPLLALQLGRDLLDAALRRLARADTVTRRRRGGDPLAAARAQRDDALRRLGALAGNGEPAERVARALVERLDRYTPAPNETSRERQLLRQVVDAGLRVPSAQRIRKILVKRTRALDDQTAPPDRKHKRRSLDA
jgi:hypothetical protein